MNLAHHSGVSLILRSILFEHWDEVPQTVEMGHSLTRWCTSSDKPIAIHAQIIVARILYWCAGTNRQLGYARCPNVWPNLPEKDIRDNIALGGVAVLLDILIRLTRQYRDQSQSGQTEVRSQGFTVRQLYHLFLH